MSDNGKYNVNIHIKELVLPAIAASHQNVIANTVQQEVTRLLSQGKLPPTLTRDNNVAQLDGGSFKIEPDDSPETMGIQIARNLYGGLKQ